MSDPGFDWGDLFDDLLDWIDDLWPGSGGDPIVKCAFAIGRKFPEGSPEYIEGMRRCREMFGGVFDNTPRPVQDAQNDVDAFLEDLLGSIEGGLDDMLGVLSGRLGDMIGGVGEAGVSTIGDLRDLAGSIFGGIGESSRGALDILGLTAGSAIENVGGVLGDIAGNVGSTIEDFLRAIRDAIRDAINSMTQAISDSLRTAINTVTQVVGRIVDQIQDVVTTAIDSITNLLGRVIDTMQELISSAIQNISDVAERVFNAVAETVENIRVALSTALDNIVQFIGDNIQRAGEFINEATNTLQQIGAGIVENAEQVTAAITGGIDAAISELVDTAGGALALVRAGLDNLQTAVTSALEGIGPILQTYVATPIQETARQAVNFIASGVNAQVDQLFITPTEDLERILRDMGLPEDAVIKVKKVTDSIFAGNSFIRNLFLIFIAFLIALSFAQQIAQAAGIKALQEIQPSFPVALPDPQQIADMVHFGSMDEVTAQQKLQKAGYAPEDAERLAVIRQRLPDIGIIQVWFLRGFVDRATAAGMLGKLGMSTADSQRILDMAFFIPPAQDLITMAVREVFSPEIAERFGQFQDLPEEFTKFAAQQGISAEWARNYWAAHWALPSVQMGFEMLHRKVIDQADLELLLRSQDVMPFWRDKLIAISYSPLTRVDVRRMHKMGVLDDAAVKKAYQDIGYDDTNAELLLQFTKELNAPKEGATPEQLDELTRSAITNLYGIGTLTRNDAFELLQAIGVGSAAASIFLDMVDLRNEAEQREAQTQLILDQAKAGIIRFSEAQTRLEGLGLEPLEVQRALVKLQAAQDAAVRLPSTQQLDDMLRANIIPTAVYLDTMLRLGYSVFWAERLMSLARSSS